LIFLELLNFKTRKIHVFSENKSIEDTVKPHSVPHDRSHTFHERDGHVEATRTKCKVLEQLKFGKSHVKFSIDKERFSALKKQFMEPPSYA
jgi:hypothetical protein